MSDESPFHEGEIAVQLRTSERDVGVRNGRIISDALSPAMRTFLAQQSLVVLASEDAQGRLWISPQVGTPGFVHSNDGRAVTIAAAFHSPDDPVWPTLHTDRRVGMLVIDLPTRRRLRINGVIARADAEAIEIGAREVFANCTKYIHRRESVAAAVGAAAATARGDTLDAARRELVARVDTGFVASTHPERGPDASHRGGPPGFVQVVSDRVLRIPDYPGNSMFQTLGNFEVDARAALALIDFAAHRVLVLSGTAAVTYGAEDPESATLGTGRYWSLGVDRWVELPLAGDARWTLADRGTTTRRP